MTPRKLKRVVIKEELVALTGHYIKALILNQMIYWCERVNDFDQFLLETKRRKENQEVDLQHGWIYKNAKELSGELMIDASHQTIRRYTQSLIDAGFIQERHNPKHTWDRTMQYRVDLAAIITALGKIGYALDGYSMPDDCIVHDGQCNVNDGQSSVQNGQTTVQIGRAIPEITTKITTKTKKSEGVIRSFPTPPTAAQPLPPIDSDELKTGESEQPEQPTLPIVSEQKPATLPTSEQQPIPPCAAPLPAVAVDALRQPSVQKTYNAAEGFRFDSGEPGEWKAIPNADPHGNLGRHGTKLSAEDLDTRLITADGLIDPGKGGTVFEIWREAFTWDLEPPQVRWVRANVKNLVRWREITAECGVRGFKTFKSVKDVYLDGFRDEKAHQNEKYQRNNQPGTNGASHINGSAPKPTRPGHDSKTLAERDILGLLINKEIDQAEYDRRYYALQEKR